MDNQSKIIMLDKLTDSKQAGTFTLASGKDIYGELTLSGPNTCLYLHDKNPIDIGSIAEECVKGVLHDLSKVSLIQCNTLDHGHHFRENKRYYYSNAFPHFVVYGERHINPIEKKITALHFVVDDASTIFYDFDAFGSVIDSRPFIEDIARANSLEREIMTGPEPQILYFTGKREIFSIDTVLGRISASHNPSHTIGGPEGACIKNTIFLTIDYKETIAFHDAITHTTTLLTYLEILAGRPQNLLNINLSIESDAEWPVILDVYWSMPPTRNQSYEEQPPHPADVLLDAVRQPDLFSQILEKWLARHNIWKDARQRLSNSFSNQQRYNIDRLIGSANMFDILPSSALSPTVKISEEVELARKKCQVIFKSLSQSPERDSVLSALGRLGKNSLKQKIRHRAQFIVDYVGEDFPELLTVTDEAVNCRNHYVHGSETKLDYSDNFDIVIFFTDTFEFIFAISDLIESGWDVKTWSSTGSTMSHPFGRYRVNYAKNLQYFKSLLQ